MDPINILKRAWQIMWSYKALWIFGVILALTTAGGGGSRIASYGNGHDRNQQSYESRDWDFRMPSREDWDQGFNELRKFFSEELPSIRIPPGSGITPQELKTLLWIGVAFLILLLIVGILLAILRYVAETALIRMVDEYEGSGGKTSIRQGFRLGWSRTSWRLFLINLLLSLPGIALTLSLILIGYIVYLLVSQGNTTMRVTSIITGIGLAFLLIFVVIVISVVLRLMRAFFWRVCALEQVGVGESLRRGYDLVRRNWKSVGLMWLVMIALGILWGVALVIAFFVLIPLMVLTAIAGVLVGSLPALIAAGISSLFLDGYLPWIVGVVAGLPLFFLGTFSPLVFLRGLEMVFTSTVWTLVYRELKVMPELLRGDTPVEIEPQGEPVDEPPNQSASE